MPPELEQIEYRFHLQLAHHLPQSNLPANRPILLIRRNYILDQLQVLMSMLVLQEERLG